MPAHQGGIPVYNHNLIKTLSEKIDFNVISLINNENKNYYDSILIPFHQVKSVNPIWSVLSKINYLKRINRYYSDIIISKNMAKWLIKIKPDIAEFMDIHSESLFFIKQKKENNLDTKIIIRSHTPLGLLKMTYKKEELSIVDSMNSFRNEKFCFENSDFITVPSADLKKQINTIYNISAKKIHVLPNIVDTTFFKKYKQRNKRKKNITLLHVGRFERAKGVETLIKSFIILCKKSYDISLISIGEPRGDSYIKCLDLLKREDLLHKVNFTGFVENNALPKYYNKSDIVIVPSEIYESFSYTVAQGMACTKPVIASNIGGIPETLNHGDCGLLFSPGNVEDLTEKIENLYFNSELRIELARKARAYCESKFSIDSMKSQYFEFYNSLLTKK